MGGARAFPGVRLLAHPCLKQRFGGGGGTAPMVEKSPDSAALQLRVFGGHSLAVSSPDLLAQPTGELPLRPQAPLATLLGICVHVPLAARRLRASTARTLSGGV